ncbi:hypothetical protein A4249_06985 [Brevundimonas sp. GW460-12-10-14-LB2]|uniref:hypothetical protein n=1 Tax=Brevundimonas sp. GW460-12-10-14-LB2 TaxID=1827469 RepID=UPI0007BCCB09|nr:hypothetical protein [Brevundimonas sp. GW460-12-10-14-LB2]ANC53423.1 hypothetical protein A4249_06985 [Brevundimonas sp. GW460-12-10-14-LB2]
MTQAPTPGPLSAEDVKLLVKGDLLLCKTWGVVRFDRFDDSGVRAFVLDLANDQVRLMKPINMAFIGRPDADGWMPWSGGENPVPGRRVVLRLRSGITSGVLASEEAAWGRSSIIAFRLAPTAPVEASGSELHPATANLVDRFATEMKSKLAKAEAKYGYRDNWSRPDWEDELTESLAEHIQKGDPRDVAAYCAFAWHHGWSTSDAAGYFAPALRPQPSGETRGALDRLKMAAHVYEDDEMAADCATLEALLSARPLALGGQHSGGEFTSVKGLWKDQRLSRLERVKAHRSEFGSELKQAVEAVDEETARQAIASKATTARAEALSEDDARRRLIQRIEQWDGETEYDAEDIGALADEILHEFNGAPVVGDGAIGYISADAETALGAGRERVIYPSPSAHASFPVYAASPRAEAQDEGAAGEQTDNAFKIASDLHAAYEQLIYGLPKYLEAENLTDEENMIREAYITLDVTAHRLAAVSDAHPSPTPAADAQDKGVAGEAIARLTSIKRSGSYVDSILDAYGHAPKGKFFDDLDAIRALYAHPSPTPAADEDRVRIMGALPSAMRHYSANPSQESLEKAADMVLDALKSTAAKEGEKK